MKGTKTNTGKYVLITPYGKYIEHIQKNGSVTSYLSTGNIDLALRINNPDAVIRKFGIQNLTIETFAENNK
jgi:hypothetical protein